MSSDKSFTANLIQYFPLGFVGIFYLKGHTSQGNKHFGTVDPKCLFHMKAFSYETNIMESCPTEKSKKRLIGTNLSCLGHGLSSSLSNRTKRLMLPNLVKGIVPYKWLPYNLNCSKVITEILQHFYAHHPVEVNFE